MHDIANGFLIDAWSFNDATPQRIQQNNHLTPNTWYHCQRDVEGLSEWLEKIGVNPSVVDAILAEDTRSKFQQINPDTFVMIVRGVNLNSGAQPDNMLSLRILYHKGCLFTLRKRPFQAIADLRKRLENGTGPNSLPQLLVELIEALHQRIIDSLNEAELFIEEMEDNMDHIDRAQHTQLTTMHRRLVKLHRFLQPQATALEQATNGQVAFLHPIHQAMINEKESVHRINEALSALQQQIWMLREHFQQGMAERMNRNTYWLSVIAGIFLPLGFLTGLLGVNIGGIPGTESPMAFLWFCLMLVTIGVVEFLLLRRLRFW